MTLGRRGFAVIRFLLPKRADERRFSQKRLSRPAGRGIEKVYKTALGINRLQPQNVWSDSCRFLSFEHLRLSIFQRTARRFLCLHRGLPDA
jgi:hypothetical protein